MFISPFLFLFSFGHKWTNPVQKGTNIRCKKLLSPLSPLEEPIQGPFTFITNQGTNIRKDIETVT
jgi:hypothetical protein